MSYLEKYVNMFTEDYPSSMGLFLVKPSPGKVTDKIVWGRIMNKEGQGEYLKRFYTCFYTDNLITL